LVGQRLARLDEIGVIALLERLEYLPGALNGRWSDGGLRARLGEPPGPVGSPQDTALLIAALRTPQSDFGPDRVRLRQFGRHGPSAATGAVLEKSLGFDHDVAPS
jgi:hypothetical protein